MNTAEPRGTNPGLCETDAVTNGKRPERNEVPIVSTPIVAQDMRQAQSPVFLPDGTTTLLRWLFGDDPNGLIVLADASPNHRVEDLGLTDDGFANHAYRWPELADEIVQHVLDKREYKELWFTPMRYPAWAPDEERKKTERQADRALPGRNTWADADHVDDWTDAEKAERFDLLDKLRATVVRSGTGDNIHTYVKLKHPQPREVIERVNRRLIAALAGDPSKYDTSSLLRMPGSYNHKRRGIKAPVVLERIDHEFEGWDLEELEAMLPPPIEVSAKTTKDISNKRENAARDKAIADLERARSASITLEACDSLGALVMLPPDHNERSSYEWIKRVAGHIVGAVATLDARAYAQAYVQIAGFDSMSTNPGPYHRSKPNKFREIVDFVWREEAAKRQRAVEAAVDALDDRFSEATGFLAPREDGHGLVTLTDNRFGKPEETPFGDFTITATGVYTRDGNTVWTVDLTNGRGREERDVEMPHDVLASTAKLRAFLLGHRCKLVFSADRDKRGPAGVRLQALLESQNPADYRVVDRIGWDDNAQAFITFEGAITANGLDTSVAIRPNRSLTQHKQVNHAFGFRPEEEVREVVREVMTFQEETYASVYGSWYLAGVVKGQLLAAGASLFPFLCVEAPAEAGKSQGYPVFWYQLTGSVDDKGGRYTQPTFRDAVASRRGPAVWVDDVSSLDAFKDDLRQATVEGHAIKMGEDRNTQVQRKLTAPIVISVEGAGSIHQEKAMKDRSLLLNTPPVKERMSLNDPTRKQWDDITALQARYPEGLSVMAGTLVQMALRYAPARIAEFRDLRVGSGRHGDKMATLRVGARILADITGDDEHIKRVDAWANGQEDTGAENVFTQKVVPNAILVHGLQEKPLRLDKAPHYGVASPVLFRPAPKGDGHHQLAVCLPNLALWHEKATPMGKVADRTETLSALMLQAAQLKMRGGKAGERGVDWYQAGVAGESSKMAYQVVPDDVTVKIFERLGIEWSPEDDAEPVKAKLTPSQAEAVRRA